MAKFKSPNVTINKTAKELFNKIQDLNNLKDLMPDSIKGFKSTETTCSFKMEDLPRVKLILKEKIPYSKISLMAEESQIPFSLDCLIKEKGNKCQAKLEINAELNMMMKMMVETPLTEFLEEVASQMKSI